MNSHPAVSQVPNTSSSIRWSGQFARALGLFCLLVASVVLFSGCARMKQYSIDSWQGPLPMTDVGYVQGSM
ncbi:MAG: hypothetical protein U1G07_06675 [Verrucomicrobiota bacterium]